MREFLNNIISLLADLLFVITKWWEKDLGLEERSLVDTAYTLAIFVSYWFLRRFLVDPISRLFRRPRRRYTFRKIANAILTVFALAAVLIVWIDTSGKDILGFFAFVSAGLAIALADPILSLAGWAFILIREPFAVKDRIALSGEPFELKGDVIDVRLFMFSVLEVGNWVDAEQSTGRIVHIPNSAVFRHTIHNYTQGFRYIWNEIPVTVTFESDWEKALKLLTDIIESHSKEVVEQAAREVHDTSTRFMVVYTRFTPIVWVKVADIGVTLTMRYLCESRRRRSSEHVVWQNVLRSFAENDDIDFAYPTMRYYDNKGEGKPLAGGPPRPDTAHPDAPPPTALEAAATASEPADEVDEPASEPRGRGPDQKVADQLASLDAPVEAESGFFSLDELERAAKAEKQRVESEDDSSTHDDDRPEDISGETVIKDGSDADADSDHTDFGEPDDDEDD